VTAISRPVLPDGGPIELAGRGTTFHRDLPAAAGEQAPTVLLLHGWTATADLNWFPAYEPLARHVRVVALDHRGHGRGIRSHRRFRLADCADDAVALDDNGVHLSAARDEGRHCAGANEAGSTGDKNSRGHGLWSGYSASRAEISTGANGQSIAKAGSFQRTPRAASGSCSALIW